MLFSFVLAAVVAAAPQGEVRASASVIPASAPVGAIVDVKVRLDIGMGYHVYHPNQDPDNGIPVSVEVVGDSFAPSGPLEVSQNPEVHQTEIGANVFEYLWLVDSPEFTLPIKVKGGSGPTKLLVQARWQVCDDALCYPATSEEFALDFEILGGVVGEPDVTSNLSLVPESPTLGGSFWGFILAAIAGGLFALLMPCTYPMIPITISFFAKQAEARGGKVLSLSLAYGAGIVGMFVLIGIAVGPIILAFATHPVTNLIIGALFLIFAFALFGWINLNPPQFLMRIVGSASQQGGYLGVFLMGATLVISSFTCTAPFVGSLLSVGASGEAGGLGRVALGMGAFGLTMALPFVFLALAPSRIQRLPQSGLWMDTLKFTLGFVELAAALKFLSNADVIWRQLDAPVMGIEWGFLSRERFLVVWALIFTCAAAFLFGCLPGKRLAKPGTSRLWSGFIMSAMALYCAYGAQGGRLGIVMTAIAPNYSLTKSIESRHAIIVDDFESARVEALNSGKLLFINFTGYT